jgi:hypothetical protein
MSGESISPSSPLVLEVERSGFWLSLAGEKLYLAFADFPWFAGASIDQLSDVQRPSADHLYWPMLDIDLSVASIRDPAAFPLIAAVAKPA